MHLEGDGKDNNDHVDDDCGNDNEHPLLVIQNIATQLFNCYKALLREGLGVTGLLKILALPKKRGSDPRFFGACDIVYIVYKSDNLKSDHLSPKRDY